MGMCTYTHTGMHTKMCIGMCIETQCSAALGAELHSVLADVRQNGFGGDIIKLALPANTPPGFVGFGHIMPFLSRGAGRMALDLHTMLVKGRQLNYEVGGARINDTILFSVTSN